ncbi:unnamed protein product [Calicophoron daubneyi]|uniref:Cyclin-like domain-containing protein n=1 Tax=Calicophoron daubneyi TaxID=300641 RepID=A0AAV2TK36_CALDB
MSASGGHAPDGDTDFNQGAPVTVPQPQYDRYFSANEKIIQDLLLDEKRYHSTPGYCIKQPIGLAKWMRRTLLNWLRDVCLFRGTDGGVLAHTAQLIDRYMHVAPTDRREYQLVGATCFFISSKLKETVPVSLRQVAKFTDYSATEDDILAKELTICLSLQWDLTCITPIDFIAPIVDFLEFVPSLKQIIRQAALNIYTKIFHVEDLNMYLPSYMAAACILYALNLTVHPDLSDVALRSVTRIQQLLKLEARKIREIYQALQSCFEPGTVQLSKTVIDADSAPPPSSPEPPSESFSKHFSSRNGANLPSCTDMAPLATSTQLNTQRCNESCSLSSSSTAVGSSGSFDRSTLPTSSSFSVGSSSSETENVLIHNEKTCLRKDIVCAPRHSAPMIAHMKPPQVYQRTQVNQHPNVNAAGQTLRGATLTAVSWENAIAGIMGPVPKTADLLALKAIAFPADPRFLIVTTGGLPTGIPRWTPTDVREVRLD